MPPENVNQREQRKYEEEQRRVSRSIASLNTAINDLRRAVRETANDLRRSVASIYSDVERKIRGVFDRTRLVTRDVDRSVSKLNDTIVDADKNTIALTESINNLDSSMGLLHKSNLALTKAFNAAMPAFSATARLAGAGMLGTARLGYQATTMGLRAGAAVATAPARAVGRGIALYRTSQAEVAREALGDARREIAEVTRKKLGLGILSTLGGPVAGILTEGLLFGTGEEEKAPREGPGIGEKLKGALWTIAKSMEPFTQKLSSAIVETGRAAKAKFAMAFTPTSEFAESVSNISDKIDETNQILKEELREQPVEERAEGIRRPRRKIEEPALFTEEDTEEIKKAFTKPETFGTAVAEELIKEFRNTNRNLQVMISSLGISSEEGERASQAKFIRNLTEAFKQATQQTNEDLRGYLTPGPSTILAYALPFRGLQYMAEVRRVGGESVYGQIAHLLGLIYIHQRFASDEVNQLLMQIAELIRLGFGIPGTIERPKPRTVAEWLGRTIGQSLFSAFGMRRGATPFDFIKQRIEEGIQKSVGVIADKVKQITGRFEERIESMEEKTGYREWRQSIVEASKETVEQTIEQGGLMGIRDILLSIRDAIIDLPTKLVEAFRSIAARGMYGIPAFQREGVVREEGLAYVHSGEVVAKISTIKELVEGKRSVANIVERINRNLDLSKIRDVSVTSIEEIKSFTRESTEKLGEATKSYIEQAKELVESLKKENAEQMAQLRELQEKFAFVVKAAQTVQDKVSMLTEKASEKIVDTTQKTMSVLTEQKERIKSAYEKAREDVEQRRREGEVAGVAEGRPVGFFGRIFGFIRSFFSTIFGGGIFRRIGRFFSEKFQSIVEAIKGLPGSIAEKLGSIWAKITQPIISIISTIRDKIVQFVDEKFDFAKPLFELITDVHSVFKDLRMGVERREEYIPGPRGPVKRTVVEMGEERTRLGAFGTLIGRLPDMILDAFKEVSERIHKSIAVALHKQSLNMFQKIILMFETKTPEIMKKIFTGMASIYFDMIKSLASGVSTLITATDEIKEAIISYTKRVIRPLSEVFSDKELTALQRIKEGFIAIPKTILNVFTELKTLAKDVFDSIKSVGVKVYESYMEISAMQFDLFITWKEYLSQLRVEISKKLLPERWVGIYESAEKTLLKINLLSVSIMESILSSLAKIPNVFRDTKVQKGIVSAVSESVKMIFTGLFEPVKEIASDIVSMLRSVRDIFAEIKSEEGLIGVGKTVLLDIGSTVTSAYGMIRDLFVDLYKSIKSLFSAQEDFYRQPIVISAPRLQVGGIYTEEGELITGGRERARRRREEGRVVEIHRGEIVGTPEMIVSWLYEALKKLYGEREGAVGEAEDIGAKRHGEIIGRLDTIIDLLSQQLKSVKELKGKMVGFVRAMIYEATSTMLKLPITFAQAMKEAIAVMRGALYEAVKTPFIILNKGIGVVSEQLRLMTRIMQTGFDATVSAIKTIGSNFRRMINALWTAVTKPFVMLKEAILYPFRGLINWFNSLRERFKRAREAIADRMLDREIIGYRPDGEPLKTRFGPRRMYKLILAFKRQQYILGMKTLEALGAIETTSLKQLKESYRMSRHMRMLSRLYEFFRKSRAMDIFKSMFGMVTNVAKSGWGLITTGASALAGTAIGRAGIGMLRGAGRMTRILGRAAGPLALLIDAIRGLTGARELHGLREGERLTFSQRVTGLLGSLLGGGRAGVMNVMGGIAKGAALGMVAGPIGSAIGALAGGILGMVGGDKIAQALQWVWDKAKPLLKAIGEVVLFPFRVIYESLKKLGSWIGEKIQAGWQWIKGLFGFGKEREREQPVPAEAKKGFRYGGLITADRALVQAVQSFATGGVIRGAVPNDEVLVKAHVGEYVLSREQIAALRNVGIYLNPEGIVDIEPPAPGRRMIMERRPETPDFAPFYASEIAVEHIRNREKQQRDRQMTQAIENLTKNNVKAMQMVINNVINASNRIINNNNSSFNASGLDSDLNSILEGRFS